MKFNTSTLNNWIKNSSSVKLMVVGASIVIFLITSIIGIITIFNYVDKISEDAIIEFRNISFVMNESMISIKEYLGFDLPEEQAGLEVFLNDGRKTYLPIIDGKFSVPSFDIMLLLRNEKNENISFNDLSLHVEFDSLEHKFSSVKYKILKENKDSFFNEVVLLGPGNSKLLNVKFIFHRKLFLFFDGKKPSVKSLYVVAVDNKDQYIQSEEFDFDFLKKNR